MRRLSLSLFVLASLLLTTLAAAQEVPQRIDINTATAADLTMLRGIGPKTAAKILKHRDLVKGYTSLRQVTEVKGIGKKTYLRLACVFMVPKEGPQPCAGAKGGGSKGPKINVNLAGAAGLTGLAGIGKKKAEAIVRFRSENGWFTAAEDLQGVKGIGPGTLRGFADQVEVTVDVNRAAAADLKALGFENAGEIIKVRDMAGGFDGLDALEGVPGIDKKLVGKAKHILTFGSRDHK